MNSFKETNLSPEILKAIGEMGFETPTEIQQQSIPFISTSTQDLIALAQTGTGKTAAFSLPILDMLNPKSKDIQLLVLCPTRELCLQIARDIESYSKYLPKVKTVAVYGGSSITEQIRMLKTHPQIIVGTPGRVIDMIQRKALDFSSIHWLILDEADEMLSMGFKDDLETIIKETPDEKQTLLFSATMSKEVEKISKNYLSKPFKISIGHINEVKKNIKHEFYIVRQNQKKEALRRLLDKNPNQYSIIFCRTRRETQDVADFLMQHGYAADALHGDLSQAQRDTVMKKFRLKNINILVATDVAARGLDVDSLTHVIHYSLPDDPEIFVHRSGRTGRAGNDGISITLIKPEESRKLANIKKQSKIEISEKQVPTGEEIIKAQVEGIFDKLFTQHSDIFDFDESLIPDLSQISKEQLVSQLLQLQLKDMAQHYKNSNDLADMKFAKEEVTRSQSERRSRRERRGKKERKNNQDMVRFFFNLGKRDRLKKLDVLDIINSSMKKSSSKPDIGDIEILEKFSFFEVDKNYKNEVIRGINNKKFKGREMRIEVAN